MPAKNVIKIYRENSYYHIYNRGVEKRKIFLDDQDHQVFLSYLKLYLSPRDTSTGLHLAEILNGREKEKILRQAALNNFSDSIDLLAFNLMPNHFHLLIKQYPVNAIKSFMQSILTKYVMYFNRKHHRVGTLFQSTYKGNIVETEEELLILSAYININHHSLPAGLHPAEYSQLSRSSYSTMAQTPRNTSILLRFTSFKHISIFSVHLP